MSTTPDQENINTANHLVLGYAMFGSSSQPSHVGAFKDDLTDTESEIDPASDMNATELTIDEDPGRYQEVEKTLELNQDRIEHTKSSWSVIYTRWALGNGGPRAVVVRKPTASYMNHNLLNPWVYHRLQPINSLGHLAELLETPHNWEEVYNTKVATNRWVRADLDILYNLPPQTLEAEVESYFINVYTKILYCLDISRQANFHIMQQRKVIVGGILASPEYAVRSCTDTLFQKDGIPILATEAKRISTFPQNCIWYRESRGIQLLAALYAFNCPTILYSQKQWKLFIENQSRSCVFTFPFGADEDQGEYFNSNAVKEVDEDLVKAIVIILLSGRSQSPGMFNKEVPVQVSDTFATFVKDDSVMDSKKGDAKPNTVLQSQQGSQSPNVASPSSVPFSNQDDTHGNGITPSFVSGYEEDGTPTRTQIHVFSQELVNHIEKEIEEQEREEQR